MGEFFAHVAQSGVPLSAALPILAVMAPPCWFCGRSDRALTSPEHVIPRSLGGGLVVLICAACNDRANRVLDQALAHCGDLGIARAKAGVRDRRTGRPYRHSVVCRTSDGITAQATSDQDGVHARLLPVEIPIAEGIVEVFVDAAVADEYDRKERERAAKRGLTIGPSTSGLEPRYPAGSDVVLEMKGAVRGHPVWMWPSLAAKAAIGVLALADARGLGPTGFDSPLVGGLRLLAFDHRITTALWDPAEVALGPSPPAPTHPLAGQLSHREHLLALYARDEVGRTPFLQLVLFGRLLYELQLPGLDLAQGWVWLLDARRAVFREFPMNEVRESLSPAGTRVPFTGVTPGAAHAALTGVCWERIDAVESDRCGQTDE